MFAIGPGMICHCAKKPEYQVTTLLTTTGIDNSSLAGGWVIIKVSSHQYWWLAGGYDLEIGHFLKLLAWWLPCG